jgi:hypothetical protein
MGPTAGLNIFEENFVTAAGILTPDCTVKSPDTAKNGNVLV